MNFFKEHLMTTSSNWCRLNSLGNRDGLVGLGSSRGANVGDSSVGRSSGAPSSWGRLNGLGGWNGNVGDSGASSGTSSLGGRLVESWWGRIGESWVGTDIPVVRNQHLFVLLLSGAAFHLAEVALASALDLGI